MATLEEIIFLVITVLLLALCLFVGDKLFGNGEVHLTSGYYISACITAIVIIVIIIVVGVVVGLIDILGIGNISTIASFVGSVYVIKALLMKGATFERSTWVGIFTWIMVYVINYLGGLFGVQLITIIG